LRFVTPFDHPRPFWFYLPAVMLAILPFSLLLPGLMVFLGRVSRRANTLPSVLTFALMAFMWCLLFYSCSGCKRAVYLLPALPPLALALGWCLSRWLAAEKLMWGGAALFVVLFPGLHVFLPDYVERYSLRRQVSEHAVDSATAAPHVVCFP